MKKQGIYVSPTEFVSFAESKASSLSGELATRNRSLNFYSLANIYLPNPDPVLKKQGHDVSVYRDLMIDDRVRGNWGNRKAATLALEWQIDRGEKGKVKSRQAKTIEGWLKTLDMDRIMSEILDARMYGYNPLELMWEQKNGLLLPRDIVGKPPEWFIYNIDNELRFRSRTNALYGEELPPRKFVTPTSDGSYYYPYGLGLLASCFWPVTFKKGGWKFWVTFAEKYGTPYLVGKHPRGAQAAEVNAIADQLEQMVQDAIAVIADDGSVEIVSDTSKSASSDLYQALITEANTAISTVIMGHAGGGQSTSGKLGGEQLAQDVRGDLRDGDKKLVCQTMNQVIRWVSELNWGTAAAPTFSLWEEEDVDKEQAERDEKLSSSMERSGLKLTSSYYQRTYNLDESDIEAKEEAGPEAPEEPEAKEPPEPVEFAEADPSPGEAELADLEGAVSDEELQTIVEGILKPVFKLFQESGDLTETMGELIRIYPKMDTDQLQDLLARIIFVSEVWGRLQGEE